MIDKQQNGNCIAVLRRINVAQNLHYEQQPNFTVRRLCCQSTRPASSSEGYVYRQSKTEFSELLFCRFEIMPHSSSSPDKLFIAFKFIAMSTFDKLACAVNQLQTLHHTEPDGPLSTTSPAPNPMVVPTQSHQAALCCFMLATV